MASVSTTTVTPAVSALEKLCEQVNRELDVVEGTLPPGGSLPRVKAHTKHGDLYPKVFKDKEVCAKIELVTDDGSLVIWFAYDECFVVEPPIQTRRRGHEVHPSKINGELWSQGIRKIVDTLTAIIHPVCSDRRAYGKFRDCVRRFVTEFNSQHGA